MVTEEKTDGSVRVEYSDVPEAETLFLGKEKYEWGDDDDAATAAGAEPEDGKRRKIAQDAYAKGKDAINKYIELGNDGLGLNFTPIDQMD